MRLPRPVLLALAALLALACSPRKVGELSSRDHAREGRPREALAAEMKENGGSPYAPLHAATLLHSAGAFAQSEAAFAKVNPEGILHAQELAALSLLRALNQTVLTQDPKPLAGVLDGVPLSPLSPSEAEIFVLVERGWAPEPHASANSDYYGIATPPKLRPVPLRLDDEAPIEPKLLLDAFPAWSEEAFIDYLRAYELTKEAPLDARTGSTLFAPRLRALRTSALGGPGHRTSTEPHSHRDRLKPRRAPGSRPCSGMAQRCHGNSARVNHCPGRAGGGGCGRVRPKSRSRPAG